MRGRRIRSASRSRPRAKASLARSSVSVARLAFPPARRRSSSVASVGRRRRRGAPPSPLVPARASHPTGPGFARRRPRLPTRPDGRPAVSLRPSAAARLPDRRSTGRPASLSGAAGSRLRLKGPVTSPSLPGRRSPPLPPRRMPSRDDVGLRSDVLRSSDFRPPPSRPLCRSIGRTRARTPLGAIAQRPARPTGRGPRAVAGLRVRTLVVGPEQRQRRRAPACPGLAHHALGFPAPVRPPRPWDAFALGTGTPTRARAPPDRPGSGRARRDCVRHWCSPRHVLPFCRRAASAADLGPKASAGSVATAGRRNGPGGRPPARGHPPPPEASPATWRCPSTEGRRAPTTKDSGSDLLSQEVSLQVPSARAGLTAVFGMGTGVSPPP